MKPSREPIVAAAVVVVVTAAVVAVIATTIVTSANHAGNTHFWPRITRIIQTIRAIRGKLLSGLRRYLQSQLLSSPHHFNCVFLTGFHFSECIRVVVNV